MEFWDWPIDHQGCYWHNKKSIELQAEGATRALWTPVKKGLTLSQSN